MSQHHAVCPPCARVVTRQSESEATDVVENHNDSQHSGDSVARVVGNSTEDLNDLMDNVRDGFDSEVRKDLIAEVMDVDPWGVSSV